jgi:hypothetical protein
MSDDWRVRAICEGSFELPLAVEEALPLFTPEGERRWAGSSWDPVYPAPLGAADGDAPGTVFTTESDGGSAVWVVVERRDDSIRYARVVPGRIAGTVTVTCAPGASAGACTVTVTYDVTALAPEGAAFVRELEANYDAFLAHWRSAILEMG